MSDILSKIVSWKHVQCLLEFTFGPLYCSVFHVQTSEFFNMNAVSHSQTILWWQDWNIKTYAFVYLKDNPIEWQSKCFSRSWGETKSEKQVVKPLLFLSYLKKRCGKAVIDFTDVRCSIPVERQTHRWA